VRSSSLQCEWQQLQSLEPLLPSQYHDLLLYLQKLDFPWQLALQQLKLPFEDPQRLVATTTFFVRESLSLAWPCLIDHARRFLSQSLVIPIIRLSDLLFCHSQASYSYKQDGPLIGNIIAINELAREREKQAMTSLLSRVTKDFGMGTCQQNTT
jgi:hypothetical protein